MNLFKIVVFSFFFKYKHLQPLFLILLKDKSVFKPKQTIIICTKCKYCTYIFTMQNISKHFTHIQFILACS